MKSRKAGTLLDYSVATAYLIYEKCFFSNVDFIVKFYEVYYTYSFSHK